VTKTLITKISLVLFVFVFRYKTAVSWKAMKQEMRKNEILIRECIQGVHGLSKIRQATADLMICQQKNKKKGKNKHYLTTQI
jgi:hypothetical protein